MSLLHNESKEVEIVGGVEVNTTYDGVKVIGICALIDALVPDYWGNVNYTYKEINKVITKWCEENDSHYYADVREHFWVGHGVSEAKEAGRSVVIVEDLS